MRTDRLHGRLFVRLVALCLGLALQCGIAGAQNSTSSPYSMFGIGQILPREDAATAALGHSGIAMSSNEWVNTANPAGLAKIDSLAFYLNFQLRYFYSRHEHGFDKRSVYSANIDGISMAFRGRKWLAFSFGYTPYSAVGYNLKQRKNIVGTDLWYDINYQGKGGLSQAYFNACVTLFDHLSLGGNFSVLWGTIEKNEAAYFSKANGGEDIFNERKYSLNNIFWEVGLQYDIDLGKNNFRIGAVYSPKIWLHTSFDHIIYNSVSSELEADDPTPNRFWIPETYGAGITWQRGPFLVTGEYKVSKWKGIPDTKFNENILFRDTYTYSGGFQFAPGMPDDPFYKRMRYRIGGFYGRDYLDLQQLNLMQSGVTLGMTIPLGNSMNAITISYERLNRGTESNGMVDEKNNNFKIGINIREIWFLKSKFD